MSDKLIPKSLGLELRTNSRMSTALKLGNFIKLRDFICENEERIIAVGWMVFYADAGDWMDYSGDSVRKYLGIIRSYPDAKLLEWTKKGLSFDHIQTANELQNDPACQYEAAHLLDAAVALCGGNGSRMTVEEMETFALGEKNRSGGIARMVSYFFDKLEKFPTRLGWSVEKADRFKVVMESIRKEFFTNEHN